MCRNGLFASEAPFQLATVSGSGRSHFVKDMDDCPSDAASCRESAYVVPGDTLIVSKLRGAFACVFYVPSQTAGWMRADRLEVMPVQPPPAASAWIGHCEGEFGAQSLTIAPDAGGALRITGSAFWPARPEDTDYGSVNIGQLDGSMVLLGNRARYDDENECAANFTLLGDYLVVGDNRQCGGMNVSFTTVYRRVG